MATPMRVVSEAEFKLVEEARTSSKRKGKPQKYTSPKAIKIETAPTDESPINLDSKPLFDTSGKLNAQLLSVVKQMTNVSGNERYHQAWGILKALLSTGKFEWNEDGNISFRGKTVPDSNIADLVSAVVNTDEKLFELVGGPTFALALVQNKMKIYRNMKPNVKKFIFQSS